MAKVEYADAAHMTTAEIGEAIVDALEDNALDDLSNVNPQFKRRAAKPGAVVTTTRQGAKVITGKAATGDFDALMRDTQALFGANPFRIPAVKGRPISETVIGRGDKSALPATVHLTSR